LQLLTQISAKNTTGSNYRRWWSTGRI